MRRDDIVLTVILAVGCAATSFALVYIVRIGIKQEPLFALVGALIGASATITGAAWLADRNRDVERDGEVALLIEEYRRLLRRAVAAQALEPDAGMPWPNGYRTVLRTLAEKAGNTHAVTDEALGHAKALSFIHRAALRRVRFAIDEYLHLWSDHVSGRDEEPTDERTFPIATAEIARECMSAIAELKATVPFPGET